MQIPVMPISLKQKAVFFSQLATLTGASVPLLKSVEILKATAKKPELRKVIDDLEAGFNRGDKFSDIAAKHKNIFTPFEIYLLKAGEESGSLPKRLKNLADYLENLYNLRMKIIGSLIYPFIILNAGLFIPPIVQAVSKGLGYYIKTVAISLVLVYGIAFALYFIYKFAKKNPSLNAFLSRLILLTPIAGGINYKLSLIGYLLNFSELYDAGINIAQANQLAADGCSNIIIGRKLLPVGDYIQSGDTVTAALTKTKLFDSLTMGLIVSGEESGDISSSLKKGAQYLGREAEHGINKLMIILPLVVFLLLGVYFGYIIITFYVNYFNNIFKI